MSSNDVELMGHLMRRAGFGAGLAELEARASRGYDATVDELIEADSQNGIDDDLLYRYHPDHQGGLGLAGAAAYWLYRMVNTRGALQEKMTLFWHSVFATGYPKVTQGKILMNQLAMFRKLGMGSLVLFATLLVVSGEVGYLDVLPAPFRLVLLAPYLILPALAFYEWRSRAYQLVAAGLVIFALMSVPNVSLNGHFQEIRLGQQKNRGHRQTQ